MEGKQSQPPETSFKVAKNLSPRDWLNHSTEGAGEFIHLFPDEENRTLWLFRSFKESGEPERLVTSVGNVSFNFNEWNNPAVRSDLRGVVLQQRSADQKDRFETDRDVVKPRHWYLTGAEANTFMAWLDLVLREPGDPKIRISWYGDNGKGTTAGENLTEESLYLRYTTDGGKDREACLNNSWRYKTHMMARYPD